jgi:hypothetical protein
MLTSIFTTTAKNMQLYKSKKQLIDNLNIGCEISNAVSAECMFTVVGHA